MTQIQQTDWNASLMKRYLIWQSCCRVTPAPWWPSLTQTAVLRSDSELCECCRPKWILILLRPEVHLRGPTRRPQPDFSFSSDQQWHQGPLMTKLAHKRKELSNAVLCVGASGTFTSWPGHDRTVYLRLLTSTSSSLLNKHTPPFCSSSTSTQSVGLYTVGLIRCCSQLYLTK